MVDFLIKNGSVVTPQGIMKLDIAVEKGTIVALGQPGQLPSAKQTLDVSGLHVLPGLVDEHVHFREPGLTYKEDFKTGSRAAAAGGVTTVFDMPNTVPPTATVEAFKEKVDLANGRSYVDFGIYGVITQDNLNQILPMAEAGAIGYKLFMGETTGYIKCPDDGHLYEAFIKVKKSGLRVGAHAENDRVLQLLKGKLINLGRTDPRAHLESRPAFAEAEAICRALIISEAAGNPFHVFHLSTLQGLKQIVDAKQRGLPITAEVLVGHLLLDDSAYETQGNLIRLNPPIRPREHQQALWEGLKKGWIDAIATDHAPHSYEEKTADNVWEAACGFIGVETALPLMLTQVNEGILSLQRYVQAACESPARIWGLYPRKGVIRVGSEADFVVVDLAKEWVIEGRKLHNKNTLTPFEGWRVRGLPRYTILRGEVIMDKGEIIGTPRGELVRPNKLEAEDAPYFLAAP